MIFQEVVSGTLSAGRVGDEPSVRFKRGPILDDFAGVSQDTLSGI